MRKLLVPIVVLSLLVFSFVLSGIITQHYRHPVIKEPMPDLSNLEITSEVGPAALCGRILVGRTYSTPGKTMGLYSKAAAVFISIGPGNIEPRPFIISVSADETDEVASTTGRTLYYDYDRDGIVDEKTARGDESFEKIICNAVAKLR
jgi:hypothetical protein